MKKGKIVKRIFAGVGILVLLLLLAAGGFLGFCAIDKKQPVSVFPHDFSVYVHANSAWDTVEPMLDLKAMDMFLSTPELSQLRGVFMQLRASQWRNNKFLAALASKSVDAAIYNNNEKMNFLISIDLDSLSFVGRCFPIIYEKLNIKGLYRENDHFIFDSNGTYYYVKPYKNLLVATDNPDLLGKAFLEDYNTYTGREEKLFKEKIDGPIKIIANISNLLEKDNGENKILAQVNQSVPENTLSLISVEITDENIKISAKIPYEIPENADYLLGPILSKKSTTPSILSRFAENIQYYTVLNAGTLEELKTAFLPLVVDDSEKLWKKVNGLSKSLLNLSIEDLLFSWSGNEIAMFGIEDRNDPVFAIQIKDEKQRQKVFEKIASSMVIKNNSSLILDGVRIPRLELPVFLQELLNLFEVSLPHPYYFIQNGFIYFSESAENLSEIYKSENRLNKLSQEENWKSVSKSLGSDSTVGLFYNLERSVPFFIKKNASISNILSLYQIGRADLVLKNGELVIQLSAISKEVDSGNAIPGFPVTLNGRVDGKLLIETVDSKSKENAIYWVENKKTIACMELPSTSVNRLELQDEVYLAVSPVAVENKAGVLWAVTSQGEVYFLNRKLEVMEGFPLILGEKITIPPVAGSDGIYITTEKGMFIWIGNDGNKNERYLDVFGSIKASPVIREDGKGTRYIGFYDKSFMGKIIILSEGNNNETYTFDIPGIAFGSPSFLFDSGSQLPYVSLITQTGDLHIWKLETGEGTVIHLDGLFKCATVADSKYFYAVSTEGTIYRVGLDGEVLSVTIPNAACNEAFVSVKDDVLYVCPDGNIVYGFDANLELVYPFPVTGWGNPVFADVNGDNKADCFTLTIDNKLNAVKMR